MLHSKNMYNVTTSTWIALTRLLPIILVRIPNIMELREKPIRKTKYPSG